MWALCAAHEAAACASSVGVLALVPAALLPTQLLLMRAGRHWTRAHAWVPSAHVGDLMDLHAALCPGPGLAVQPFGACVG